MVNSANRRLSGEGRGTDRKEEKKSKVLKGGGRGGVALYGP